VSRADIVYVAGEVNRPGGSHFEIVETYEREGRRHQLVANRICTRPGTDEGRGPAALVTILAEGIPVRTNDFSQSAVEGPRMLPSM